MHVRLRPAENHRRGGVARTSGAIAVGARSRRTSASRGE